MINSSCIWLICGYTVVTNSRFNCLMYGSFLNNWSLLNVPESLTEPIDRHELNWKSKTSLEPISKLTSLTESDVDSNSNWSKLTFETLRDIDDKSGCCEQQNNRYKNKK